MRSQRLFFAFAVLATLAPAGIRAEAPSANSATDLIPSTPITSPFKMPRMSRDQLFTRDPAKAADIAAITQVWSAYVFYHDTYDGEGLASLFAPDGIWDEDFNDNGTLRPAGGTDGNGCILRGRAQIAKHISNEKSGAPPMTIPGFLKHKIASPLIQVQGNDATLIAAWNMMNYDDASQKTTVNNGGTYLIKLRRSDADGWLVVADHIVFDYPRGRAGAAKGPAPCGLNGPQ